MTTSNDLTRRVARVLAASGQFSNAEIRQTTGLTKMQVAGYAAAASRQR